MAGDYVRAVSYLEESLKTNPTDWVIRQTGILLPLAIAYARLREREQSLLIAQQAIPVISAFNAPLTNNYFIEYLRKDILERFSYDGEIQAFFADILPLFPQLASYVKSQG